MDICLFKYPYIYNILDHINHSHLKYHLLLTQLDPSVYHYNTFIVIVGGFNKYQVYFV